MGWVGAVGIERCAAHSPFRANVRVTWVPRTQGTTQLNVALALKGPPRLLPERCNLAVGIRKDPLAPGFLPEGYLTFLCPISIPHTGTPFPSASRHLLWGPPGGSLSTPF